MKYPFVLALLVAACGGDDSMADGDADESTDTDVTDDDADDPDVADDMTDDTDDMTPDAPQCPRPSLDQADLSTYLMTAITELASTPRYSDTQRNRARAFFTDALADLGLTAERVDFPSGTNIAVTIPATVASPTDKPIIIGAHFDTVPDSPGADDNASGSALVLALARFATELPCRRSAVEFIFFDREEEGLFGSRASAQSHDPSQIRAVYTFDQLGFNADGDATFELELPTLATQTVWQRAATVVGATLRITDTENTDHQSFREEGYDASGLSEEYVGGDTTPYYHTPEDTPSTLDPAAMVLATKLAAQVMFDSIASETP